MSEFTSAANYSDEFSPRRGDAPLTAIYGIGQATSEKFHDAGYLSMYDLAAADPPTVARSIESVPLSDAREFVEQARSIVEYWPGDSDE